MVSDLDLPETPVEFASAFDGDEVVADSQTDFFGSEETALETVVEETAPEVVVTDASDETDLPVEPVIEEGWTNQTILEFVGESQTRLVSHPRYSTWGRFWWLAQFASDQIDFFAG